MGYREVRRESQKAIMVDQYVSFKYGAPGQKRRKKKNPTPEEIKKINAYTKRRKVLWRLQTYFDEGDYYITLTYRKGIRPDGMEMAKKNFNEFRDKLRRHFKKKDVVFRWMRNIEIGKRKACHVHMVVKRFEGLDLLIRKLWKWGKVDFQIMYEDGGFRKLAEYITKSNVTEKSLSETDFQSSRNMPLPEPKVKEISGWSIHRKIRVPDGWYLDGESIREGINPFTGYEYRSYMLLRDRGEGDGSRFIPAG